MNNNLYETHVGGALVRPSSTDLAPHFADTDNILRVETQSTVTLLVIKSGLEDIPTFNHPVTISGRLGIFVYVDARPFINKRTGIVNQQPMYDLAVTFGYLEGLNVEGALDNVLSASLPALRTYTNILTTMLSSKLNLTPVDQNVVRNIIGLYCVDTTAGEYDAQTTRLARLNKVVGKGTDLNNFLRVHGTNKVDTLDLMVERFKDTGTLALKYIDKVHVVNALMPTAPGMYNAAEVMSISAEYMPYWIATCLFLANNKVFKRSILGGLVQRNAKDYSTLNKLIAPVVRDASGS